jgi:hypothetical protein
MLLKGCETQGHLILSAAKAELLSSSHMPVWKDQALLSKNRSTIKSKKCFFPGGGVNFSIINLGFFNFQVKKSLFKKAT